MNNPNARLPAKLLRRVCLVLTEDAVLAEELLARKKLATEVAGRLSDRVLLIRPGRLETVLDELRKMGHTPQVVGRSCEIGSASESLFGKTKKQHTQKKKHHNFC